MGNIRERVYLSIGSNVGLCAENLQEAIAALGRLEDTALLSQSALYETAPVGYEDQPDFLNAAVEIETALAPLVLLNAVKAIETRMGRESAPKWGPRVIDIDIVLWGERQVSTEMLTIPHPDFRTRNFVLQPLAEIAPNVVDPESGKTIAELASAPEASGQVSRL